MRRPPRGRVRDRIEQALLAVMGPADVADPDAPQTVAPAGPVDWCRDCGRPRHEHEVVRAPGLTYTRCLGRQAP